MMRARERHQERGPFEVLAVMILGIMALLAIWGGVGWLLMALSGGLPKDMLLSESLYSYWPLVFSLGFAIYAGCDEAMFRFSAYDDESELRCGFCTWVFLIYFFSPGILNALHYCAEFSGHPRLAEKLFELRFSIFTFSIFWKAILFGAVLYLGLSGYGALSSKWARTRYGVK